MNRQLTLLSAIEDKKVQKEVVSILKEYRALKMRFSNEVEQEGISLFPELLITSRPYGLFEVGDSCEHRCTVSARSSYGENISILYVASPRFLL